MGIAFATIIRIVYPTPFWKALFEAHIVVAKGVNEPILSGYCLFELGSFK
jgi:hypothetical protein